MTEKPEQFAELAKEVFGKLQMEGLLDEFMASAQVHNVLSLTDDDAITSVAMKNPALQDGRISEILKRLQGVTGMSAEGGIITEGYKKPRKPRNPPENYYEPSAPELRIKFSDAEPNEKLSNYRAFLMDSRKMIAFLTQPETLDYISKTENQHVVEALALNSKVADSFLESRFAALGLDLVTPEADSGAEKSPTAQPLPELGVAARFMLEVNDFFRHPLKMVAAMVIGAFASAIMLRPAQPEVNWRDEGINSPARKPGFKPPNMMGQGMGNEVFPPQGNKWRQKFQNNKDKPELPDGKQGGFDR